MSEPLIYNLSYPEMVETITSWGEPIYRARQIWEGLNKHLWISPDDFTTLPKLLRQKLGESFSFSYLEQITILQSKDGGTSKILYQLTNQDQSNKGNQAIESVLMRYHRRRTLCISTQAGCAMGCTFCATGQMGFGRNLISGEIVEQVLRFARILRTTAEDVTNVVLMGMGEPFHNYDATLAAIRHLNQPEGFNLGMRRFTISTVGLVPAIRRFADEQTQVNLAISLHAADDELRSTMLPINKRYSLEQLFDACREYVEKTHRRISFEWALIYNVNDSNQQAKLLVQRLKTVGIADASHVNVIPLNPTQGYNGNPSSSDRVAEFKAELERQGIPCTVRVRRGIDIQAGCGQLAIQRVR